MCLPKSSSTRNTICQITPMSKEKLPTSSLLWIVASKHSSPSWITSRSIKEDCLRRYLMKLQKVNVKQSCLPTLSGFLQNNTFSRDELSFEDGDVRNIHYGDVLIKYGTSVDIGSSSIPCIKPDRNIEKFSSSSYLQNGDIVFADTAEDYAVGKATEIIGVSHHKVLSGLHTIPCRPHDAFAPMYLGLDLY